MTELARRPIPEADQLANEVGLGEPPDPYEVLGLERYDLPEMPDLNDEDYWAALCAEDAATAPESPSVDEFWNSRDALRRIHDFARARRVAPWAVLGAVLARVIVSTEPSVQLPPIIGSYASLNLFVGLVGPSGAGKDAAAKVARDAIDLGRLGASFITAPLGSGEGLSHMFMRETKEGPEQYNIAALVTIGEIDTLTALAKRQSSTVGSQLRQAAMGEQLGFFYVDSSKRMLVPEHRYRMCLIAGIQPRRAGALMEESDGGTPQRFIWLPATDPDAPDVAPECPAPLMWIPPKWHEAGGKHISDMYRILLPVCEPARKTIVDAHLARTRGTGEALDGHALLTRLKVAAALAILEGRAAVEEEDWALSGTVMAVSDATRAAVVKELAAEQREQNRRQAEAEAVKTIVVQERVEEASVRRVARNIKRHLAGATGWVTHNDLRKAAIASRDKAHYEPALAALVRAGEVEEEKVTYHGKTSSQYRLAGDAS